MNTQTNTAKEVKRLPIPNKVEPTEEQKKAAAKAMIEKFKPEPPRSADDRIMAIGHFEALSKRYKILKEKANELKMFDAGNDKTNAKISFKNAQGFEFDIRNSTVIEKLKTEAEKELNILLAEAENEILTFQL
jgi:hypothetical protein